MEFKFRLQKIIRTETQDGEKTRYRLTLEIPEHDAEFALTATFSNEVPNFWKDLLGSFPGDRVLIKFGPDAQQSTLEEEAAQ